MNINRSSFERFSPGDSLKFLTGKDLDAQQDLLDYLSNNSRDIRGDGFYQSNTNTPHFESNLMDVQSFYNINNKYDGLDLNQLKEGFQNRTQPKAGAEEWKYKNELPMNGGQMGSVVGYTKIDDDYAYLGSYPDNFLKDNSYQNNIPGGDDLRYDRRNYSD